MLVFGDKIDLQQGIGAVIVFLGIILDMTSKKSNQKSSKIEPVLELEDFSPKDESRGPVSYTHLTLPTNREV